MGKRLALARATAALGVIVAAPAFGVFAQQISSTPSVTTGASLLNACRDMERLGRDAVTSTFLQGYCLGAVDTATILHDRVEFCIPGVTPKLQLVRIVVSYLERNPAKQDRELAVLASYALSEAYPCPVKNRR